MKTYGIGGNDERPKIGHAVVQTALDETLALALAIRNSHHSKQRSGEASKCEKSMRKPEISLPK